MRNTSLKLMEFARLIRSQVTRGNASNLPICFLANKGSQTFLRYVWDSSKLCKFLVSTTSRMSTLTCHVSMLCRKHDMEFYSFTLLEVELSAAQELRLGNWLTATSSSNVCFKNGGCKQISLRKSGLRKNAKLSEELDLNFRLENVKKKKPLLQKRVLKRNHIAFFLGARDSGSSRQSASPCEKVHALGSG